MTETDKRYFIKRINEIKTDLINNVPESPNMTFDEYKEKFSEMVNDVYKKLDKTKRDNLISNLFSKTREKVQDTGYYGEHSFDVSHINLYVKDLIPDFNRIKRELNVIVNKRKDEEKDVATQLRSKTNEICDHIRFGDVEEFYGKTMSEIMEEFSNFYSIKKAA